jgi:hypothetical protein
VLFFFDQERERERKKRKKKKEKRTGDEGKRKKGECVYRKTFAHALV